METENRKSMRRNFLQPALILGLEKLILETVIFNLSQAGAQLNIASTIELPTEFTLVLSKGGKVRRRCAVVWRSNDRVGVRFLQAKEEAID